MLNLDWGMKDEATGRAVVSFGEGVNFIFRIDTLERLVGFNC